MCQFHEEQFLRKKKLVCATNMVGMAVLQKDTQLAGFLREGISDLQARLPYQLPRVTQLQIKVTK